MKILLDENLPHGLRPLLTEHDVETVAYRGWSGIENGELLKRAADAGFDVLLSKDAGIAYEQNLKDLPLSVILIGARSNTLDDIRPLIPDILAALKTCAPRSLRHVGE